MTNEETDAQTELCRLIDTDDVKSNTEVFHAVRKAADLLSDFDACRSRAESLVKQRDDAIRQLGEMCEVKAKMEGHLGIARNEIGDKRMRELLGKP